MCFQACSRNPIGIDRDPLLLVSLSEPMKLKEPPGEVEGLRGSDCVRGATSQVVGQLDQPPSTWQPTNAPAAAPTGTPTQRPLFLDKAAPTPAPSSPPITLP